MRLLVLGGSSFVGRAVVDAGLGRGWPVTVFNRGGGYTPPGVEHVRGDRTDAADLAPLRSRSWDMVIDTWRYAPRAVHLSCEALAGRVDHYGFISSTSVYRWPPRTPVTEDADVVKPAADLDTDDRPAAKSSAETTILDTFGDRALLARAGMILGPYEYGGRLSWWLLRFAERDRVLAPTPASRPVQYIDARDLAEWMLDHTPTRHGAFNLACPRGHTTMADLLAACAAAVGSRASVCWLQEQRLLQAGVQPWVELPIWVPETGDLAHIYDIDVAKSVAAGLACRPIGATVTDTWDWLKYADPRTTGQHKPWLSYSKEQDLLGST
jgi:2'-hydroxyisoflavone reductase